MNIEEIKERFNGICVSADIWHPDDMELVNELISKLERAEKALNDIVKHERNDHCYDGCGDIMIEVAEGALIAIRGN